MFIRPYRQCLAQLFPRREWVYIHRNRTVLATGTDGFIETHPELGLFVHQTRLLSHYRYQISGKDMIPVNVSPLSPHHSLGYYIALPPGFQPGRPDTGSDEIPPATQQTLELCLSRTVGAGFHEDVDLTNFTQQPTQFRLDLEVDADFADMEETRGERKQKGRLEWKWKKETDSEWNLTADYHAHHKTHHLWRGFKLRFRPNSGMPMWEGQRFSIPVALEPRAQWHMCVELIPHLEGKDANYPYTCYSPDLRPNEFDKKHDEFLDEAASFSVPGSQTLGPVVVKALEQAKHDLLSLRLHDLDLNSQGWVMAAGLPAYIGFFGRDTLTASWQAAFLSPKMMRGTLIHLARYQGRTDDDWRDEQPGRMLHEAHTGPLSVLDYTPRLRYYGAATTSAFYAVVLSELWHWTGSKDAIFPLIKPALDSLHWLDAYTNFSKDGFYKYQTRSRLGLKNQGWKDSGDAIVYEDGTQVEPPIATCEEQAFVYAAKLHMSEILWWFDRKDLARELYRQASDLKKRFNDAFWMEKEGFIAMGIDANKRQIKSIGSNAGHCLAAALMDKALVQKTADRLFQKDLFSGWGIRTLSSDHPAYNPYSYHRGSIWPVEQGTFAFALMRYGLTNRLHELSRAQFELASLFPYYRLPELVAGHQRTDERPLPALYPNLNWPQAWSASACFCLVQALLGLYPYAPMNMLMIDPHLPAWLPEITIHNLHVGRATITIHFFRRGTGKSDYQILNLIGPLHVIRQPSPWSLTAPLGERLKDALVSLTPGK